MNLCISNFTVFGIREIILFSVFLQKYCLVYYHELQSSQNSTLMLYIFLPGSVPQYGIGVIPKDEVQE